MVTNDFLELRYSLIHLPQATGSHNMQILAFHGSSHFSAPDASCTPSLSRYKDGLLISDMDLNLCRQLREGFRMTARYELYADMLARYLKPDFEAPVISDPLLHKSL
jgi:beta-ureidopropionase